MLYQEKSGNPVPEAPGRSQSTKKCKTDLLQKHVDLKIAFRGRIKLRQKKTKAAAAKLNKTFKTVLFHRAMKTNLGNEIRGSIWQAISSHRYQRARRSIY
jgi:hypothetical protein